MNIIKVVLLFLIYRLCCLIHITASVNCPTPSFCGNLSFPIKYPFHLLNTPPQISDGKTYCSYPPGFTLSCNPQLSKLILNIPYSGDLYVKNISYIDRRIYLHDPDNCLPKRLLTLNFRLILSSTFYVPISHYEDYRLFSCPPEIGQRGYSSIPCLSNSSVSVVEANYSNFNLMFNNYNCSNVSRTISGVPTAKYDQYSGSLFDEIVLSWLHYSSPCECCDDVASYCYYTNSSTHQGNYSNTYIISIPLVGMALLVASRRYSRGSATASQNTATTIIHDLTATQPPSTTVISGLHDSNIQLCSVQRIISTSEYYSNICAICLSDFCPEEAIRCIVECQHYFHTDCIDKWLKLKGMCPVCPNILLPSSST